MTMQPPWFRRREGVACRISRRRWVWRSDVPIQLFGPKVAVIGSGQLEATGGLLDTHDAPVPSLPSQKGSPSRLGRDKLFVCLVRCQDPGCRLAQQNDLACTAVGCTTWR